MRHVRFTLPLALLATTVLRLPAAAQLTDWRSQAEGRALCLGVPFQVVRRTLTVLDSMRE
jgi:hypothetical protein